MGSLKLCEPENWRVVVVVVSTDATLDSWSRRLREGESASCNDTFDRQSGEEKCSV
jgi:hypothetical protein